MNSRAAWWLRLEGSEFGPFSEKEALNILNSQKTQTSLYAKRVGNREWFLLSNPSQLTESDGSTWDSTGGVKILADPKSKRNNKRVTLLATISKKSLNDKQMIGVCADVSHGGMQVTNAGRIPFQKGEVLELIVHPIANDSMEAFTVKVKVAWMKEDTQKVGFQFIDHDQNYPLQRYIDANT